MNQVASRIRILVVDDDPDVRLIVRHSLADLFEVVTANSGVEALEYLDEYEPDLIIMDVSMPVLSGFDTARAVKKDAQFARVPILFLTGRTDNAAVREAMLAGGEYYLAKPFDPQALLQTVQTIVENRKLVAGIKRHSVDELEKVINQARKPENARDEDSNARGSAPRIEFKARSATPSGSRVRVLIVDDDPDVVNYVKSVLRDDYEVIGVCDSEAAPAKIIAYQPDILLLDIVMPKLNGFHLSQLIRINKRLRGAKIVFVSSKSDPESVGKAFSLGACEYIEKPFTPEQLRRRIVEITRQPDFVCMRKRLDYAEILRREGEL